MHSLIGNLELKLNNLSVKPMVLSPNFALFFLE
jgi:hypothetical protein